MQPFRPVPPPVEPDAEAVTEATAKFRRGLVIIALVVAILAVVAWLYKGLQPDPAASARCKGAKSYRACEQCCAGSLASWTFGTCSCNVQTR